MRTKQSPWLENRNDIQVILTDIAMPGSMDIVHDRWPRVHIVITSGNKCPRKDEMPEHRIFIPKLSNLANVLDAVQSFSTNRPWRFSISPWPMKHSFVSLPLPLR